MKHTVFICWFVGLFGCESREFQKESGQVESFAEMVAAGVKPIALGPPMTAAEVDLFMPEMERLAEKYGVQFFREPDLIKTDLFSGAMSEGKEVLMVYKEVDFLQAYHDLKKDLSSADPKAKEEMSRRFGRLLGYPVWKINELLEENSDFRDLEDFGIQGQELNWYYRDLSRAKDFYKDKMGLILLAEEEQSATFQLAGDSRLVLHDVKQSDYDGREPKSVALALLTDELDSWYAHIQNEKIPVKYTLKRNPGGPHDGFVAVDPEGYLLEFETFYQHPENEPLIQELGQLENQVTKLEGDLSLKGSVTWLYYQDMLAAQQYVEEQLGLQLSADQGWAKIYRLSSNSYLGLVYGLRGMNSFSEEKLVAIKISLQDPEGWEAYLNNLESEEGRERGSFQDAGGYSFTF